MVNVHTPVEELVTAVANSGRWKDRLDLRVNRVAEWPSTTTPYGTITDNTVVVSGQHIISGNDYWGLQQALELCDEPEAAEEPMPI